MSSDLLLELIPFLRNSPDSQGKRQACSQIEQEQMTIDQFRKRMASDEPIVGGSDLHRKFHQYSQEALRITAEINGSYHTPEELRRLLSELWAVE